MSKDNLSLLFTREALQKLFPATRANQFFEALFGDAVEGAYDIELVFKEPSAGAKQAPL